MYWKMYADYRKEHIITTGMCTPRLAEIAHCEIRNLHLLSQRLPIKEVARSCGYRDYGYFLETFKRIVGITPGEFLFKNAK